MDIQCAGNVCDPAKTAARLSVQGVTANYAEVNDWHPASGGAFITQNDIDASARVALIDSTTAEDYFGTANPVGQTLLIGGQVFTVIGVMEERSTTGHVQPDRACPDYDRANPAGERPCRR